MTRKSSYAQHKASALLQRRIAGFFSGYLPGRRSEKTIAHYKFVILSFLRYLSQVEGKPIASLSFDDFTKMNVESWVASLKRNGASCVSVNNYISVIRSFMKYVGNECNDIDIDISQVMSVERLRIPANHTVRFLEPDAWSAVIRHAGEGSENEAKDFLFLCMLYDTGARVSELTGMRIGDVVLRKKGSYCVIANGKGGKVRNVPLTDSVVRDISAYIEQEHVCSLPDAPLFFRVKANGERVQFSNYIAGKILRNAVLLARADGAVLPERVTCHMVRHSRAMHLYRNGMSLALIGQLLGHSDSETTLIYAYADTEMKRKAIEKATDGVIKSPQMPHQDLLKRIDDALLTTLGLKN